MKKVIAVLIVSILALVVCTGIAIAEEKDRDGLGYAYKPDAGGERQWIRY